MFYVLGSDMRSGDWPLEENLHYLNIIAQAM